MKIMLRQRHSIIFSIVFTRITMIGKVKNMNQTATTIDFLSSVRAFIVSNGPLLHLLDGRTAQQTGRPEYQNKDKQQKGKDVLVVA